MKGVPSLKFIRLQAYLPVGKSQRLKLTVPFLRASANGSS
jgi:hypothetical protein